MHTYIIKTVFSSSYSVFYQFYLEFQPLNLRGERENDFSSPTQISSSFSHLLSLPSVLSESSSPLVCCDEKERWERTGEHHLDSAFGCS